MAGHSKWAKLKHFKGAIDAKRAKIFAKLSKEIMVATKLSKSGDPDQIDQASVGYLPIPAGFVAFSIPPTNWMGWPGMWRPATTSTSSPQSTPAWWEHPRPGP